MVMPYVGRRIYGSKKPLPKLRFKVADNITEESSQKKLYRSYQEFITELEQYFSYPRAEITRLVNCVFHNLLTTLRRGQVLRVPYFGTFSTVSKISKIDYDISTYSYLEKPRVSMRFHPIFIPSPYAIHCCSPRGAFSNRAFMRHELTAQHMMHTMRLRVDSAAVTATRCNTKNNYNSYYMYNSTAYWEQANIMYRRRCLMLYDNPYTLTGVFNGYLLPDSGSDKPVSPRLDPNNDELRQALELIDKAQEEIDKEPIQKFVVQASGGGVEGYTVHNYHDVCESYGAKDRARDALQILEDDDRIIKRRIKKFKQSEIYRKSALVGDKAMNRMLRTLLWMMKGVANGTFHTYHYPRDYWSKIGINMLVVLLRGNFSCIQIPYRCSRMKPVPVPKSRRRK